MLPFGSLAPGILLPVIAFAYMLFFGACALNKGIKGNDEGCKDLSTEKKFIIKDKSSVSSDYSLYFQDHNSAKTGAIRRNRDIFLIKKQFVSQIIKIPDKLIISNFHSFSLFSRPPPVYD